MNIFQNQYHITFLLVIFSVGYLVVGAGNSLRRGRLSTVDLLIKIGCFVKKGKFKFEKQLI